MAKLARSENQGLDLSGKTAVVSGGTQGIGAAVATRFAKAGANVVVVGRNEAKGQAVVDQCRIASSSKADARFVKADLSLVSGQKQAAKDIAAAAPKGIDFLVQSQGGPPNGRFQLHSFAVQPLSRFTLPYLLLKSGALKKDGTLVNVGAPGGGVKMQDVEDIELIKWNDQISSGLLSFLAPLRRIPATGMRDGVVMDAVTEEIAERYPSLRALHLFPGLVGTDSASNRGFPWPLPQLYPYVAAVAGLSAEDYAEIPVRLATQPASQLQGRYYSLFKPTKPNPWSIVPENRKALWEKLASML